MQSDNFVGDTAAWWIRTKPRTDQPLFLEIGFPGPHPPYDPPRRYAEPYLNRELPLLEVTDEEAWAHLAAAGGQLFVRSQSELIAFRWETVAPGS